MGAGAVPALGIHGDARCAIEGPGPESDGRCGCSEGAVEIDAAINESLKTGRISTRLLEADNERLDFESLDQVDAPVTQTVR